MHQDQPAGTQQQCRGGGVLQEERLLYGREDQYGEGGGVGGIGISISTWTKVKYEAERIAKEAWAKAVEEEENCPKFGDYAADFFTDRCKYTARRMKSNKPFSADVMKLVSFSSYSIIMFMSSGEIIKEALSFTPGEKAKMIEALLDGMDKPDPEIDALWGIEAEARLAAYKKGLTKTCPL